MTVAGLIHDRLGSLPAGGEQLDVDDVLLKVTKVRGNVLEQVHLRPLAARRAAGTDRS